MIVNHEKLGQGGAAEFGGGLGIYDVSRPSAPKLITKWRTAGRGVHRYDFDGRYAYISPTAEGYVGNIMMILDLADPARPAEVWRWWIPGPVEGRRRALSVGQLGVAALPSSAAPGRPALCQLLAPRPVHPRHFRHGEAESGVARQHQPGLPASDPHLPADPAAAEGPAASWWWRTRTWRSCGRRRRPSPGSTTSPSSRLPVPIATFQVPGLDRRRQPAAADERLPSAVRALHRHGDPVRLVRAGPAARRHRRPVRAARGRPLPARSAGRRAIAPPPTTSPSTTAG